MKTILNAKAVMKFMNYLTNVVKEIYFLLMRKKTQSKEQLWIEYTWDLQKFLIQFPMQSLKPIDPRMLKSIGFKNPACNSIENCREDYNLLYHIDNSNGWLEIDQKCIARDKDMLRIRRIKWLQQQIPQEMEVYQSKCLFYSVYSRVTPVTPSSWHLKRLTSKMQYPRMDYHVPLWKIAAKQQETATLTFRFPLSHFKAAVIGEKANGAQTVLHQLQERAGETSGNYRKC